MSLRWLAFTLLALFFVGTLLGDDEDDSGRQKSPVRVRFYRPSNRQPTVYIGDAVFTEGARPDISSDSPFRSYTQFVPAQYGRTSGQSGSTQSSGLPPDVYDRTSPLTINWQGLTAFGRQEAIVAFIVRWDSLGSDERMALLNEIRNGPRPPAGIPLGPTGSVTFYSGGQTGSSMTGFQPVSTVSPPSPSSKTGDSNRGADFRDISPLDLEWGNLTDGGRAAAIAKYREIWNSLTIRERARVARELRRDRRLNRRRRRRSGFGSQHVPVPPCTFSQFQKSSSSTSSTTSSATGQYSYPEPANYAEQWGPWSSLPDTSRAEWYANHELSPVPVSSSSCSSDSSWFTTQTCGGLSTTYGGSFGFGRYNYMGGYGHVWPSSYWYRRESPWGPVRPGDHAPDRAYPGSYGPIRWRAGRYPLTGSGGITPFGAIDSPTPGRTPRTWSSPAVTGWVLDDVAQGGNKVYSNSSRDMRR